MTRDRILVWDGCLNIRDLGGLPTRAGGATRFGAIVRADSIRQLSDAGWEALVGYGVRRIVDLRFDSELAADPPREMPVEVVHASVLPDADSNHWVEIDALGDAAPDAPTATKDVYLEFLERFGASFARAITAVADAPEGGVLIHCMAGRDRTGLLTALLLRLAEVPIPEVAADYALSAERASARPRRLPWSPCSKNSNVGTEVCAAICQQPAWRKARRSGFESAFRMSVLWDDPKKVWPGDDVSEDGRLNRVSELLGLEPRPRQR
jgi:protein-tyrosine phosphatase